MEIEELIQTWQPALAAPAFAALKQQLEERIAYLIDHDFERLVRLLYTIDVDERDLKHLLQQQHTQPSHIITELIIKRQLQKWAIRQQPPSNAAATDEERW